ncbi:MAG: hypothetical protein JWO38_4623 [Gemmataceae bacterium]|nr:hypothetical protein [Gemmataceae bacterium]
MRLVLITLFTIGSVPAALRAGDLPGDWAYKPITNPPVPTGKGGGLVRTPVDAFLLARLEARGLTFAPPADKRTLLRRISFDLIGLPPTPEEVDAFLKDDSPEAFEKVVDRLLASPLYGERQALFWLDLVRFAESDGFKSDDPRPNAWRYRDYVIRSFNADKPYDRFVKEQLAGDELFPGDPDSQPATGFLRHFPYEYNAVDVELKRQDMLNDITDTTAAALLGVTLGCAKCHDHKTDPVTQRDYYRFQAFFAGFWPVEKPVLPPGGRAAIEQKQAEWDAKTADLRRQMTEIEKPIREKATAKERQRFPEEYARLLDIPAEKRTPLERQLGMLVERQVYTRNKINPAQMTPADREKWTGMARRMTELEKDRPADPPTALAMTDIGPVCPPTKLLKRGNWRAPGEELVPGFLSAVDDRDATVKPTSVGTSGRRSALANWIADPANPLTARVMANRIWQTHFGRGIVSTSSDFGLTGDRPTHPELLDWLATRFTRDGWSVKKLHRLIVTSTAYRQSARGTESGAKADPGNALLWQFPRRRLDGEALRDSMLATAGLLNPQAGGPSVFPELPAEIKSASWKPSADPAERNRRSVYVYVKRNLRYPFFSLFDSPERTETCSRRFVTTTAPQALTLLNDAIVLGYAKVFAARVLKSAGTDPDQAIERSFELALSRGPTTEEREALRGFLKQHKGPFPDAVTDLCHALLNLNEFLYVD